VKNPGNLTTIQDSKGQNLPQLPTQYRVFRPNFLVTRIGETALQLGIFAMMTEMGMFPEPFKGVVLAPEGEVANETLLGYFKPWIEIARKADPLELPSFNASDIRFPDGNILHEDRAAVALFKLWEDEGRGPLLSLTKEHRKKGEKALKKLGLPGDAWFVALHVRDQRFFENDVSIDDSANDFRNAEIESFYKGIETITNAGGWIVRLGHPQMPPLPTMPQVIDYAHSDDRSDWLDIYLMAAARFFLGTTSGPWIVADLFGVPVAQTNNTPFSERPFSKRDIYISKLHLDGLDKPISFDEAMRPPYRNRYSDVGPIRDNTADEINGLVIEMLDELNGRLSLTKEDEARQAQITALSEEFERNGVSSRMGRTFLKGWESLLPNGNY